MCLACPHEASKAPIGYSTPRIAPRLEHVLQEHPRDGRGVPLALDRARAPGRRHLRGEAGEDGGVAAREGREVLEAMLGDPHGAGGVEKDGAGYREDAGRHGGLRLEAHGQGRGWGEGPEVVDEAAAALEKHGGRGAGGVGANGAGGREGRGAGAASEEAQPRESHGVAEGGAGDPGAGIGKRGEEGEAVGAVGCGACHQEIVGGAAHRVEGRHGAQGRARWAGAQDAVAEEVGAARPVDECPQRHVSIRVARRGTRPVRKPAGAREGGSVGARAVGAGGLLAGGTGFGVERGRGEAPALPVPEGEARSTRHEEVAGVGDGAGAHGDDGAGERRGGGGDAAGAAGARVTGQRW